MAVKVDYSSLPFNNYVVEDTSDPAKFELWKPKIAAYLEKRDKALAPFLQELNLPDNLDTVPFTEGLELPKKYLTEAEYELTEKSATQLAEEIAAGKLTAVETLKAFMKRAAIAHQVTNCIMEFFPDEAMARAEELDKIFAETGKTVGPLHGLPISLKEHYKYKGHVCHGSYVGMIENYCEEHAVNTQNLWELGAVFFVRTTEPQGLMHLDSFNNITGRGRNPSNTTLSIGGSSSGEGAIAKMRGAALSVGTDGGGSIRAPAAFNGVFGLKETGRRISINGLVGPYPGQENNVVVMGPISRYPEDLDLFMKASLSNEPWKKDSHLIPLPWREEAPCDLSKVKIGIVWDDGIVRPHPTVLRGLKHTAEALKKAGATVVDFVPPLHEEAMDTIFKVYCHDANEVQKTYFKLSGEPVNKSTLWSMSFGTGDEGLDALTYDKLNITRNQIRDTYHKIMDDEGIDYIISPVYVGTAPRQDELHYWGYTTIYNLLDLPNFVFPTGCVGDPALDKADPDFKPRNDYEKYEHEIYEPEKFVNAPICLQMTGRRFSDEKLVKAGIALSKVL